MNAELNRFRDMVQGHAVHEARRDIQFGGVAAVLEKQGLAPEQSRAVCDALVHYAQTGAQRAINHLYLHGKLSADLMR